MQIIGTIIFGAIVGFLARVVIPGRQAYGFLITILLGIGGALIGYWLWGLLGGGNTFGIDWIRLAISVAGRCAELCLHRADPAQQFLGGRHRMRLSARVDYALRAMSSWPPQRPRGRWRSWPPRSAFPASTWRTSWGSCGVAVLRSQRGPDGGHRLARPAAEISIADVIRALDGELANVRGNRPEYLAYIGAAAPLQEVWIALRASERAILEGVTLAHVVSGEMPQSVAAWWPTLRPGTDPSSLMTRAARASASQPSALAKLGLPQSRPRSAECCPPASSLVNGR